MTSLSVRNLILCIRSYGHMILFVLQVDAEVVDDEDTSTFSKVVGTVAFVALGAALVAMVLRKPPS